MFCESCLEKLSDATLRGERMPVDAQEHLERCASCREAVSRRKALFERVEWELGSLVNADVPPSLVPKVRARIAEKRHSWRLRPALVYAAAFAALLGIAIVFGERRRSPSHIETASAYPAGPAITETSRPSPGVSLPVNAAPAGRESSAASGKSRVLAAVKMRSEPEVLISTDEQLGLLRYEAILRARVSAATVVAAGETQQPIKPLEIAELDLKRLAIEPLAGETLEKDSMK